MEEKGLTREKLAKEIGVSKSTVTNIFNIPGRLNRKYAIMLADYFNLSEDYFFDFIIYNMTITSNSDKPKKVPREISVAKGSFALAASGVLVFNVDEDAEIISSVRRKINTEVEFDESKTQEDPGPNLD